MSQKTLHIKIVNSDIEYLYNSKNNQFHKGDAGFDLYCPNEMTINPGETKFIDFGIQTEMCLLELIKNSDSLSNTVKTKNISYYLYPRSSISKTPLMMANSVGIIDAGYRGNIKAAVKYIPNAKNEPFIIKKFTRLFQICTPDLSEFDYKIVDTLTNSSRGSGAFGSTGI